MKAAFSLRQQGERASVPSALTKGFSGRQPLVVSEACSEAPARDWTEPSTTCDTSSAGAQLEEKQLVREGSAVSINPLIWELKVELQPTQRHGFSEREDENPLSAVHAWPARALVPEEPRSSRNRGNNQSAKVSNHHLNSSSPGRS